jgi:hypothetical protein
MSFTYIYIYIYMIHVMWDTNITHAYLKLHMGHASPWVPYLLKHVKIAMPTDYLFVSLLTAI